MSNKCKTERITYYRAVVNKSGFEKGDIDSIEEDWYDSNGNIYKSVSKFSNGPFIQSHTLYDEQCRIASIIRKDRRNEFVNSTIFRYDEAGHIMKKLFYYPDYQMSEKEEDEETEEIQENDELILEGWNEYQYNADFSSATILRFDFDERPRLVFTRIESYDSDGELVEQVEHIHGNDKLSGHIYVSKDENGNKIVTTEGTTFKNYRVGEENTEYETYKYQEFYNSNGELYLTIHYSEGIETYYQEYRYEYDEQGRVFRVLGYNRNTIETIEEHEYDLNLNDLPEEI